MSNIIVFDAEREAGLEEQIKSQAPLAYVSQLCPAKAPVKNKKSFKTLNKDLLKDLKATAGQKDGDVYNTFSILVSTSWNKNDDVFAQDEVWAARQTPTYKPANLEHDEKQIVGGIIGTWPVDSEYKLIAEDSNPDSLPDTYHLLVSSVIYNQWHYIKALPNLEKKFEQHLFDLKHDFLQKQNLFFELSSTKIIKKLKNLYLSFYRKCIKFKPSINNYYTNKKEMDRLKTLGYVE